VDGPAEADRIWLAGAWLGVAQDPGGALAGWARKCWLHLQGWEIAQVTPLSAWPQEAPVLRLLPVPWAWLVTLGLVGAVMLLVVRPAAGSPLADDVTGAAAVWASAAGLLVAMQSLFFVVSRYRLLLAPMLAVLAGLALVALLASPRRRRWLLALPVALVIGLATVPWGLDDVRRTWTGLEAVNQARRLMVLDAARDQPALRARVESLLADATLAVPERADAWRLRARNLQRDGRPDEALAVLTEGAMVAADPEGVERERVATLLRAGRLDEAEAQARRFLLDRPGDPDMLHDLAVLQGRRGRWTSAERTARALQAAAPGDHRGWLDLAVALARQGRRQEAGQALRDGLTQVTDPDGRELLEENLRRLEDGDPDR
jgi:Flp pilus assembly protein TadD